MIYIIGDTQLKLGVKNPLIAIAHHICFVKPKYVVHLGDHWDMPSLSLWDKGKKKHSVSASYVQDMKAGNHAMDEFWAIIKEKWSDGLKKCTWFILVGNHEIRRERALDRCDPEYSELIETINFNYNNWDTVIPFLEVLRLEGIEFSHYFCNTGSAHAIGTARQLLLKRHVSCVAGHKQGFDYAEMLQGADKTIQSIICGSSYYHKEEYKNHNNHHFRGTCVLYNIGNPKGFDFARYSMDTLDKLMEEI